MKKGIIFDVDGTLWDSATQVAQSWQVAAEKLLNRPRPITPDMISRKMCIRDSGMGISVGRLREDTVYDYKFVGLSHNTVRGAAGGAVLCAELLTAKGYIAAK